MVFNQLNILPRWAIFFIDIFIAIVSFGISFLIKNDFSLSQLDKVIFLKNSLVLVAICAPVFLLLKTYAGIIRLTTIQDALKVFVAVVLINGGFIAVYLIASAFFHKSFISITTLVINGFVSFFLLLVYRMGIRYVFSYLKNSKLMRDGKKISKNLIIYGADERGMATLRSLEQDTTAVYNLVCFLDANPGKGNKVLDGRKVFHHDVLQEILLSEKVDELIIAIEDLPVEKKNELVDVCLSNGVKVLLAPPVREWMNGQLSARQIHSIRIEELLERPVIQMNTERLVSHLKGKRILVTGAAGSIGRELVRQLTRFNPAVIILVDFAETAMYETEIEMSQNHSTQYCLYYVADIRNHHRMRHIFNECNPQCVFHAAAYKHVPLMEMHPYEAVATNVQGTRLIADLSVEYHVERFIMISSDKSVNPTNVMGATKRMAEIYVQTLNNNQQIADKERPVTKFITTRFGNVLGSNGSVVPRFEQQIRMGGPVTVTHPDISRYFMTIPEACQLVLEAGSMGEGGEIFVFDMGKLVKIIDLANKMIRLSGYTPGVDIEIKFTGLRPGEKIHEELLASAENTRPTYNDLIMIAQVRNYDYAEVMNCMNRLDLCMDAGGQERELVGIIKEMIPEYISRNSVFEGLDSDKQIMKD
jgi:FlaA1/EpsC-like NDP-sugar epimerase